MATIPLPVQDELVQARFWGKVDVGEPHECWPWNGTLQSTGYGSFMLSGRGVKAHRVSAAIAGLDVDGVVVRHDCDNRKCVNPGHLRTGTVADNNQDMRERGRLGGFAGKNSAKTHCPKGHALSGDNLRVTPRGLRACRACHYEHGRDFRLRKGKKPRIPKSATPQEPQP